MNTIETVPGIPAELKAQLRETLDDLVKGIRRPEKMKAACQRMDRMREENRKVFGEQNIAVDLIREARDRFGNG
jgi:chromatin segregation and condensation protein Rec8/ScpA/Scc1 (kleisin family)